MAGQKSGDFDRWGSGGATGEAVEGRVCFFTGSIVVVYCRDIIHYIKNIYICMYVNNK